MIRLKKRNLSEFRAILFVRVGRFPVFFLLAEGQLTQLTPYTYNCPIQSGSNVSFTLSTYNGDVTNTNPKPSPVQTQTIPNNPVTGSFTTTLWQDPTSKFKDVRMDHMSVYGPTTIPQGGWTDLFQMTPAWVPPVPGADPKFERYRLYQFHDQSGQRAAHCQAPLTSRPMKQ